MSQFEDIFGKNNKQDRMIKASDVLMKDVERIQNDVTRLLNEQRTLNDEYVRQIENYKNENVRLLQLTNSQAVTIENLQLQLKVLESTNNEVHDQNSSVMNASNHRSKSRNFSLESRSPLKELTHNEIEMFNNKDDSLIIKGHNKESSFENPLDVKKESTESIPNSQSDDNSDRVSRDYDEREIYRNDHRNLPSTGTLYYDDDIDFDDTSDSENNKNNSFDLGKTKHTPIFDIRKSKSFVADSIDLTAGDIDLPNSSPTKPLQSSSQESTNLKDLIFNKQKSSQVEILEIEDSQEEHESIPIPHTIKKEKDNTFSFPTPKTLEAKNRLQTPSFQTPSCLTKNKRHQLSTPSEQTPSMKKSKTLSKKTDVTKPDKADLTTHPLLNREWIGEDFRINPSQNNYKNYAYEVVIRGNDRKCLHGKTCKTCEKFYDLAGDLPNIEEMGPKWNDENDSSKHENGIKFDIVSKTSRHKELWERPKSPPGFGQFDFPSTQEQIEYRRQSDLIIKRIGYERLYSALNDQKFIFRDEKFNEMVRLQNYTIDETIFWKYLKRSE